MKQLLMNGRNDGEKSVFRMMCQIENLHPPPSAASLLFNPSVCPHHPNPRNNPPISPRGIKSTERWLVPAPIASPQLGRHRSRRYGSPA